MKVEELRELLDSNELFGKERELAELAMEFYDDAACAYSFNSAAEEHIAELEAEIKILKEKISCQLN